MPATLPGLLAYSANEIGDIIVAPPNVSSRSMVIVDIPLGSIAAVGRPVPFFGPAAVIGTADLTAFPAESCVAAMEHTGAVVIQPQPPITARM